MGSKESIVTSYATHNNTYAKNFESLKGIGGRIKHPNSNQLIISLTKNSYG